MGQMGYAEYRVYLPCSDSEKLLAQWDDFMSMEHIMVEKKTKRGFKKIDLKEQTEVLETRSVEGGLELYLRLPAGSTVNVNPSLLIETFEKRDGVSFGFPQYCRVKLLSAEKSEFF